MDEDDAAGRCPSMALLAPGRIERCCQYAGHCVSSDHLWVGDGFLFLWDDDGSEPTMYLATPC